MYYSPKDSRPFCKVRYALAQKHLKRIITSLDKVRVVHAGYGSFAVIEVLSESGAIFYYQVPFKAYRMKKKLRIHVTSAYPVTDKPGGGKVGFFTIAYKLLVNKPLPHACK